ncbi:hypothetical protein FQN55_008665 [Onygenales sp. PD_40]|nr:hypothetical protein FQN55_008665 [Onygenales sp. PD_40]
MAALDKLPIEILEQIVEELDSLNDMQAVSSGNRRLHQVLNIAERRAFYSIPAGLHSFRNVYELLVDILERPRLGFYVREFTTPKPEELRRRAFTPRLRGRWNREAGLVASAIKSIGCFGEDDCRMIFEGICMPERTPEFSSSNGCGRSLIPDLDYNFISAATTAVFISRCPNLRKLNLSEINFPAHRVLQWANIKRSSRYLQHLREARIIHTPCRDAWYEMYGLSYKLSVLHQLPSIETLDITSMPPERYVHVLDKPLQTGSSNVKNLTLHGKFSQTDLAAAIVHCRTLERFSYSTMIEKGGDGSEIMEYILRELRRHRSTLKRISLDLNCDVAQPSRARQATGHRGQIYDSIAEETDLNPPPSMGSSCVDTLTINEKHTTRQGFLNDFPALRYVDLDIRFLLGSQASSRQYAWDIAASLGRPLSPNLECLTIVRGTEIIYSTPGQVWKGTTPVKPLKQVRNLTAAASRKDSYIEPSWTKANIRCDWEASAHNDNNHYLPRLVKYVGLDNYAFDKIHLALWKLGSGLPWPLSGRG